MKFSAVIGTTNTIAVERRDERHFLVGTSERLVDVEVLESGVYSLIIDGHSYEATVREEKKGFLVEIGAHTIPVRLVDPSKQKKGGVEEVLGEAVIASPMPGRVVGIKVEVGQAVREGEGMIVVEAMKMENELHAPKAGKITKILVKLGEAVEGGQELVVVE